MQLPQTWQVLQGFGPGYPCAWVKHEKDVNKQLRLLMH